MSIEVKSADRRPDQARFTEWSQKSIKKIEVFLSFLLLDRMMRLIVISDLRYLSLINYSMSSVQNSVNKITYQLIYLRKKKALYVLFIHYKRHLDTNKWLMCSGIF